MIQRRDITDFKVKEIFYRTVVQAMLLFVSEYWVVSVTMYRTVEGTHTGFLRKISVKRACQKEDRPWDSTRVKEVREPAGIKLATTYVGRKQGTEAQWVELLLILK